MSQRLFISHASEDETVVERIVAYLEARGRPCWIASRDIAPESIYADAIAEGMQECSACVVILSEASNQSKAVKRELELASHYDKPFIPIRVDSTEPARGFDYYLRNAQWLDYRRHGETALDRILSRDASSQSEPPRAAPMSGSAAVRKDGAAFTLVLGSVLAVVALIVWASLGAQRNAPPATEMTTDIQASAPAIAPAIPTSERQAVAGSALGNWETISGTCSTPWRFTEVVDAIEMRQGPSNIEERAASISWGQDRNELLIDWPHGRRIFSASGDLAESHYVTAQSDLGSDPCSFRRLP